MKISKNILKEAVVLIFTVALIFSSTNTIANTVKNAVPLKTLESTESNINLNYGSTNFEDLLWDNGMTNTPEHAWSNFDEQYAGANRSLMDDFVIPPGEEWRINELQFTSVWSIEEPGHGTDFVLSFWSDNSSGPGPGERLITAQTLSYAEEKTGDVIFSRNITLHTYQFMPIVLTEGTYWIEGRTVGMDNNFWLVNNETNITGSECWLNWEYDDYFGNGTNHPGIGYPADLIFALYHDETIEPPEFEVNITGLIGLKVSVTNIGFGAATNVSVNITLTGGFILFGGSKLKNLNTLNPSDVGKASLFVIGVGKPTIDVEVTCDEGVAETKSTSGSLFLFFWFGIS